jgi:sulfur-carrier protein
MPTVLIPALLRTYSGGRTQIQVPGETLRQVFDNLDSEFPGIRERIVEEGRIRPEISIAVDNELVDTGLLYRVPEGAEIVILPAISGG